MAFSSLRPSQNFPHHFTEPAKRTLRYRHHTRITNPAHQSVPCASTYFRMSTQMGKADACQHAKRQIVVPVFGFYFVIYVVENELDL